ncbi:MAG: EpsI family protein [Acidobacteriia bacterium]|nr:EpsI family protein [Terriglobia bacterium]
MVGRALIVSCLLVAGAVYIGFASKSEPVPIRRSLSELPARIGVWEGEGATELDPTTLRVLGVDDYTNRRYFGTAGASVGLYIGYYRSQRQGNTIHSPLNCLPGAGWNPVEKDILPISINAGAVSEGADPPQTEFRINRIVIQRGMDKQVVLYWYQSHGRVVASEYWGKIYAVLDAIRTSRTDAALVRVISPVTSAGEAGETTAEQNAVTFVRDLLPLLGQYLPD